MCGVKCITFALWINILSVLTGKKTSHRCLINLNLPHFIILTVHCFFYFFFTGENKFRLELTPLNPVIHVGTDLELTCQMNDCPDNVTFIWKSALDEFLGGEAKDEQTVSRLMIKNISVKHSDKVLCKAICQQSPQEKITEIHMFCK